MEGLMQHWALTVDRILDHAKINFPRHEIVTRSVEGPIVRTTYAEMWERSKQVSAALLGAGIKFGDRVATLALNTARHMEVWYGAMGVGMVVHTVNPRLMPEQIVWMLNHAEDRVLFFDLTFLPLVEGISPYLKNVEHYVFLTDKAHMPPTKLANAICYEEWIAGRPLDAKWGDFDENTAAGLCYTSGTTGDPKGVLYSHRSNVLHAMAVNNPDALGVGGGDVALPIVPMFHANAWALVFAAPIIGAKCVLPGVKLDGPSLYELMESEKVTFTAAVPTVWLGLLNHLRQTNSKLSTLKRVIIGGSAVPEAVLRAFEVDYDVRVCHAWGMTEMSPVGTIGALAPEHRDADIDTQIKYKLMQGRGFFTVDMQIVDEAGNELPRDGQAQGRVMVRGPAVARAYFKGAGARNADGTVLDETGYFDTGDVATIDGYGYLHLTDRAKDVIKSGGEWISSIDVENIAMGAPGVANAAVIGMPHPKWDERPLLIIEKKPGENPQGPEILAFLQGKIAKWWMPDDVVFVEKIPIGPTGKINKLALRKEFATNVQPTAKATS